MTYLDATCNACSVPLRLKCDDDYAAQHDPWKLARLVVCERCYDLHTRRQRIEDWIANACHTLALRPNTEKRAELKLAIYEATKKYAQVIGEQMRLEYVQWDDAFPEALLETPDAWPRLLRHYRKTCATCSSSNAPAPSAT